MYCFLYILMATIVALLVGIWLYREHNVVESWDYIPAIIAGFLWPISIVLFALLKILDVFKDLCIYISNRIDDAKHKKRMN